MADIIDDRVGVSANLILLHSVVLEEMEESVEAGFEMVKVKFQCFLPRKLV